MVKIRTLDFQKPLKIIPKKGLPCCIKYISDVVYFMVMTT